MTFSSPRTRHRSGTAGARVTPDWRMQLVIGYLPPLTAVALMVPGQLR